MHWSTIAVKIVLFGEPTHAALVDQRHRSCCVCQPTPPHLMCWPVTPDVLAGICPAASQPPTQKRCTLTLATILLRQHDLGVAVGPHTSHHDGGVCPCRNDGCRARRRPWRLHRQPHVGTAVHMHHLKRSVRLTTAAAAPAAAAASPPRLSAFRLAVPAGAPAAVAVNAVAVAIAAAAAIAADARGSITGIQHKVFKQRACRARRVHKPIRQLAAVPQTEAPEAATHSQQLRQSNFRQPHTSASGARAHAGATGAAVVSGGKPCAAVGKPGAGGNERRPCRACGHGAAAALQLEVHQRRV
eukprot:366222-Chlamydomonas_euryale.AAC.6